MMKICPLCRTNAEISDGSPLEEDNTGREFVQCPVCGRYDLKCYTNVVTVVANKI